MKLRSSINPHECVKFLALAAIGSALGCASDEVRHQEPVSKVTAAIGESEPAPSFSLSIPLPPEVRVQNVAVAAVEGVRLADRVQVSKAVVSMGSASTGAQVEVGTDTRIGPIESYGNVMLRDRATVDSVVAAGTVESGSSVTVNGTVTPSATLAPPINIQWNVAIAGPNLGPVSIEPDSTKDIAPGRFALGSVKSRSTLTLHAGTYYFDDLTIEPQARLLLDDSAGPVLIYIGNSFTFRGSVASTTAGIPKLLVGLRGTGGALIEAPFTGVLVAPEGSISLQAATTEPHRAVLMGKRVNLEPDIVLKDYSFDWPSVVGGVVNPDYPDDNPHRMIKSTIDVVLSKGPASTQSTLTSTSGTQGKFVQFTLPENYTVDGGIIANGTVSVSCNTPAGNILTCSYQGQSTTATPTTTEELVLGRMLKFVSCSDGLPAKTQRACGQFTTTVDTTSELPVTITSPVQEVDACREKVEIISALDTYNLRKNFSWASAAKVEETNAGGDPTLFYAWVYIRNREDLLNLKKMRVHQMTRPLFTDELDALAGKCGVFRNPGDGEGFMVPVVIPGKTYNALIDVQHRDDISGDKVLFDAVIIREVPEGARNPNGSIKLDVLKDAHFVYMPYEKRPLPSLDTVTLDSGVSKTLMNAISWVGQAAKDVGEFCTNVLAYIDRWLRGTTTVNLQISAITRDPMFGSGYPVMTRGWGDSGGQKLGAPGLQVSVLQKFLGSFIPETSMGHTGPNGNVSIDAVEGGSIRGDTGLCIELSNDAAKIVGDSIFFLPEEICDFRAFDANVRPRTDLPGDFKLQIKSEPQSIHIENTLLMGMYQADDVYRYGQRAIGISPKQARIITGYWADTISPDLGGGVKNLWAPCLNYPNSISDVALAVCAAAGAGGTALVGGYLGGVAGVALGAIGAARIALHIGNADIVMPENSRIPQKRAVMSHEMGHYMFCSMLQEERASTINWLALQTIAGSGLDRPVRYLNEAVADYFTGQVTSGADYGWAADADFTSMPNQYSYFCTPVASDNTPDNNGPRCWETNLSGKTDAQHPAGDIGRVATLLQDAADNPTAPRGTVRVEMGNAWNWTTVTDNGGTTGEFPLYYGGKQDFIKPDFEQVSIGPSGIRTFAHRIANSLSTSVDFDNIAELLGNLTFGSVSGADIAAIDSAILGTMDDAKIYAALNGAMADAGFNWCDRCSVLALHEPGASSVPSDWSPELFKACRNNNFLAVALENLPPEPNLNLERIHCSACPAGTARNSDYSECVPCSGVVVDDQCIPCPPDIVLNGSEITPGAILTYAPTTPQPADDTCPNILWVEVQDVPTMFNLHSDLDELVATPVFPGQDQAACTRQHTLHLATQSGSDAFAYSLQQASGDFDRKCTESGCFATCVGAPVTAVKRMQSPSNVMFGIPTAALDSLRIAATVVQGRVD